MQTPTMVDPNAAIEALMRPAGTQLAGDVVPLPIQPGPQAGPTPNSAPFGWGDKSQPGVIGIGAPTMQNWLQSIRARQSPSIYGK